MTKAPASERHALALTPGARRLAFALGFNKDADIARVKLASLAI